MSSDDHRDSTFFCKVILSTGCSTSTLNNMCSKSWAPFIPELCTVIVSLKFLGIKSAVNSTTSYCHGNYIPKASFQCHCCSTYLSQRKFNLCIPLLKCKPLKVHDVVLITTCISMFTDPWRHIRKYGLVDKRFFLKLVLSHTIYQIIYINSVVYSLCVFTFLLCRGPFQLLEHSVRVYGMLCRIWYIYLHVISGP